MIYLYRLMDEDQNRCGKGEGTPEVEPGPPYPTSHRFEVCYPPKSEPSRMRHTHKNPQKTPRASAKFPALWRLALAVLLVSAGCAKQTGLSGGERDTVPPQVLEYNPPLFSTLFEERSFSITFDEFFSVENLNQNLIISPPLKVPPEYRIRGKTLTVSWVDTLLPHTTYQFNFGNSVVDITERNPAENLVYVFSTGTFIDSLSIGGSVVRALDGSPVDKAAVMLYHADADSLPLTVKPDYFALSDAAGNFEIKYLPEGDFKVFVLKEEAPNYIYNGPPEIIGFPGYRIASERADSTREDHRIFAFIEEDSTQYVVSTEEKDFGYYQVVFNLPVQSAAIEFRIPDTDVVLESQTKLSEGRDTLRNWLNLTTPEWEEQDELLVVLRVDTLPADTNLWYVETDPRFRDKPKMELRANNAGNKLDLNRDFGIRFRHPVAEIDTSLIALYCDSTRLPTPEPQISDDDLHIGFPAEFVSECNYRLVLEAGAFRDVFDTYNDSTTLFFSLREVEYYGSLIVSIGDSLIQPGMNPLLQLVSASGSVLRSTPVVSNEKISYEQLAPGSYSLKIVYDENENGEWDSGRYRTKKQPEKVSVYPEAVEVRSNWDVEIEWAPVPPYGL